jgi:hypothetical protein
MGAGQQSSGGFGFGGGGFQQQQVAVTCPVDLTKQVSQLDEVQQKYILETFEHFKKPARSVLDEIKLYRPEHSELADLSRELSSFNTLATRMDNKQQRLKKLVDDIKEEVRGEATDIRKYKEWAILNLKHKSQSRGRYNAHANSSSSTDICHVSLGNVINKLEKRLIQYSSEVEQVDREFRLISGRSGAVSTAPSTRKEKVGAKQLSELIQRQHKEFLQLAAQVAESHENCERARDMFLRSDFARDGVNPFDEADREEAVRKRQATLKLSVAGLNPTSTDVTVAGQNNASMVAGSGGGGFGFGTATNVAGGAPTSGTTAHSSAGFGFGAGTGTKVGFGATATGGGGTSSGFGAGAGAGPTTTVNPTASGFGAGTTSSSSTAATGTAKSTGFGFGAGTTAGATGSTTGGFGFGVNPAGAGGMTSNKGLSVSTQLSKLPTSSPSLTRNK